jgi:hypothetical protein
MSNFKNPSVVKPYLQTTKFSFDSSSASPGNYAITDKYSTNTSDVIKVESLIVVNDNSFYDAVFEITLNTTSTFSQREIVFKTKLAVNSHRALITADAPLYITGDRNLYVSAFAVTRSGQQSSNTDFTTQSLSCIVNGVEIHE